MATRRPLSNRNRKVILKSRVLFRDAEKHFVKAMHKSTLTLQREVQERTPMGVGDSPTGHARATVASEVRVRPNKITGIVGSSSGHIGALEDGTRPHFPPIDALVSWVRLKLGVADKDARSVAFLVARKISRRGTEPVKMFAKGWRKVKPQVNGFFKSAVKSASAEFKRK